LRIDDLITAALQFTRAGRLSEAEPLYRQALTLLPASPELHYSLGITLQLQGKWQEAALSHARALALKPDFAEAYNNLGSVLLQQNKLDEAVAACARAVACKPDDVEALINLGTALQQQGKPAEAQAVYRQALVVRKDCPEASLGLAVATVPVLAETVAGSVAAIASFERALDELEAWDAGHPGLLGRAVGGAQPFHLAYRPIDVTATLVRYGTLISRAAAQYWSGQYEARATAAPTATPTATQTSAPAETPAPTQTPTASRAPGARIRFVIINGQIRGRHPVWEIVLRGLIAHLDRTRFELIVYYTCPQVDDQTHWAKSQVDRFVQGARSTQDWLVEIARDRPEVIFYPEVGMDPTSCALAALRLAPLQVAGWGHPVTTGLPTIDWFLSGELLEGPAAEGHYHEKLIRLPGTGVCTEPVPAHPEPWSGPQRHPDRVRFVLCQQPIKFDPMDDALLVRIAQSAGPCEIWLASPRRLPWTGGRLQERLATAFRSAGLDPAACLRVTPWLEANQFAGFLDEMDVYLDCPSFSGYTTAWQAAQRGLPIVTLEGQFLRQRLAAGLLKQIGVTDGIATSADEYVAIAVRKARQCRHANHTNQAPQAKERREKMRRAAAKADNNRAAVTAFEHAVLEHFNRVA
jgi:protein O-GlcNAc transferase